MFARCVVSPSPSRSSVSDSRQKAHETQRLLTRAERVARGNAARPRCRARVMASLSQDRILRTRSNSGRSSRAADPDVSSCRCLLGRRPDAARPPGRRRASARPSALSQGLAAPDRPLTRRCCVCGRLCRVLGRILLVPRKLRLELRDLLLDLGLCRFSWRSSSNCLRAFFRAARCASSAAAISASTSRTSRRSTVPEREVMTASTTSWSLGSPSSARSVLWSGRTLSENVCQD